MYDNNNDNANHMLRKAAKGPKNVCGIIIEGYVHGIHKAISTGGIEEEAKIVKASTATFTHHKRDGRWCVHPDNVYINALWLTADYEKPGHRHRQSDDITLQVPPSMLKYL